VGGDAESPPRLLLLPHPTPHNMTMSEDADICEPETKFPSRVQVAHACNPSFSGGLWFKASPGKNSSRDAILKKKKTHQNKGLKVWALSSSPSTARKPRISWDLSVNAFLYSSHPVWHSLINSSRLIGTWQIHKFGTHTQAGLHHSCVRAAGHSCPDPLLHPSSMLQARRPHPFAYELFAPGWPSTASLWILASQVTRITDVSHQYLTKRCTGI
jgi:hypothetical protein